MSPLARPVQDLNWLITNFVERVASVAHAIVVSADGVKVEAGNVVDVPRETCSIVEASAHQGGLVARGISYKK